MKGSAFLPLLIAAMTPFLIFTLIILASSFGLVAWQPPVLWQRFVGMNGGSTNVITSDLSGVYVQGYTLGPGSGSFFLNKYDLAGGNVWTRTIGYFNNSLIGMTEISDISVGPDGIYISGAKMVGTWYQGILQRYDSTGNMLWEKEFSSGEADGGVMGISVAPQGVYVTGVSVPLTNQPYTGLVTWVREYDFAGNVVWTSEFSNDTTFFDGVYASSSGVYVSYYAVNRTQNLGPFLLKYDSAGTALWTRHVEGAGSTGDSTGVYLVGTSLTKYDFNGNEVWATTISSPDLSPVADRRISASASGIYVSLNTVAGREFLQKYDFNGHGVWSLQMQNPSTDVFARTAFRLSAGIGAIYIAGSVFSNGYEQPLVGAVNIDSSLVFFGLNPPYSFMLLGGLIGGSAISIIVFRRLRRDRVRPRRVGLPQRSLPAND